MKLCRRHTVIIAGAVAWLVGRAAIPAGAQTVTFLRSFSGGTNDAAQVLGSPASAGATLFGVASRGGTNNQGVVFSVSTNGANLQILHSFTGEDPDGCCPDGSVVLGGDTLYATAGFPRNGLVFSVGTNGANFQVLHDFEGGDEDGAEPFQSTALLLVGDTLYGVTDAGGSNDAGVVYSISTNGADFRVLHSFTGSDGRTPAAPLTPVGDTLFGVTPQGGSADQGVAFAVNTNGDAFQVLHDFAGGADGSFPGPLTVVGSMLFGLTQAGGGNHSNGTLYAMNMDGSGFQVLHSFGNTGNDSHGDDTGLTVVGGSLYGMSSGGGNNNMGGIFSISTNGTGYGMVYSFSSDNGNGFFPGPYSSLTLVGTNLFGFTNEGGTSNVGTVFMLQPGSAGNQPPPASQVTFTFETPVQTCKSKTKIDKKTTTTNVTTTCKISVNFVATNTGISNSPAFSVLLWAEEGDSFADNGVFLAKKVKALKAGKSATIKQKAVFTNDQAGTFFYLTDTNLNILASVPIQ